MTTISYTIPSAGSTLNSMADPEIATALQTLLTWANGNVDTTNLSAAAAITRSQLAGGFGNLAWTSVAVPTTAVDGKFYGVTAATTITLPAPTLNATIGVMSNVAGVVTVTASSGSIVGAGLNATSFTLGVPNAAAVLLGNGTSWLIVAGQQDTGWVALTALSGFTVTGGTGYTGSARLRGDMVELSGAVKNVTGGATGNAAWASLPASIPTPAQLVGVPAITGASVFVPVYIGPGLTPSNAVWVFAAVPNNGYVSFDGLRYRVS